MIQKRLSGEFIGWNPETRVLQIRFRKWWETGQYSEAIAPFVLDPYAIMTSAYCGTLRLSDLAVGQRVTLTYVTGTDGRPIAKALSASARHGLLEKPRTPCDDAQDMSKEGECQP